MSQHVPSLAEARQQGINAEKLLIHVIACEFNKEIIEGLLWGARYAFEELAGNPSRLFVHQVPGAVEVPLKAQLLLEEDRQQGSNIDAIVTLGAVIKGDTDHYDYVCGIASEGIMQVMLKFSKPISFGILTTQNNQQARLRSAQDSHNKGIEAMLAAVKMVYQNPASLD